MRRVLIGSGLLLATLLFVTGCGGGSSDKAPLPPNADKIKVDMSKPGGMLPPPGGFKK